MKGSIFTKIVVSVLLIVLVFSFASPAQTSSADSKARVWVQFQPGAKGAVENALKGNNAEFHYTFDDLNAFVVSLPSAALAGLEHNPNVVMIEEDAPRFPIGIEKSAVQAASQVTLAGQTVPYGVDMVQARDIWDANRDGTVDAGAPTGSTRKICIIDSGLYTGHEDLSGITSSGYNGNLPWNTDGDGHGSHVAGTIAAVNNTRGVVGVTPGTVQLYIVRVFGDNGTWAYSSSLADAANRCKNGGANVISMSLGGTTRSVFEQSTFDSLYSAGILSIAAAGNDGNTQTSYPAGYDSVMSVAAVDSTKAVASFSQRNADVEIAAPGVGVLSTVPYIATNTLTVNGTVYSGGGIEYAASGNASGQLVDGGLCGSAGSWSGKVVVCQRGTYDFYTKVMSVQNGGGVAAVIYNNVSGGFAGTLGDGNSSDIPAISLSMEDGQALVASGLGQTGAVNSTVDEPASGYEYYDGTSMATPHVSAVAALVWSANTGWTNAQVRAALNNTAQDLGAAGRDNSYGYGLVQAKAALTYLQNQGSGSALVVTVTTNKAVYALRESATITVTVKDSAGRPVSGAAVSLLVDTPGSDVTASATTSSKGTASFKLPLKNYGTGSYTVNVTASKAGYTSGTATTSFTVR